MSFWPLPTNLVDLLRSGAGVGPLLEVGAGAGALAQRLLAHGLDPLRLDRLYPRLRPAAHAGRDIAADALNLPMVADSLGGILLANTLRHLPPDTWSRLAQEGLHAVAPGGVLVLLEDDPRGTTAAETNYREALAVLAQVDDSRGGVVSADDVEVSLRPSWGVPTVAGRAHNEEPVGDPMAPWRWLEARPNLPLPRRDLQSLVEATRRHGMAYGPFWYRGWEKPA